MKIPFIFLFILSFFLIQTTTYPNISNETINAITDCLTDIYHLDQETTQNIINRLSSLLSNPLLKEFIDLSKTISLNTNNTASSLIEYDACLKASEFHRIIFENNLIRILDITAKPGEKIPLHIHQWDAITIVTQGSLFETENFYGNKSIEDSPISVGKFEGNIEPYAYTNIGHQEFTAISFEFKD